MIFFIDTYGNEYLTVYVNHHKGTDKNSNRACTYLLNSNHSVCEGKIDNRKKWNQFPKLQFMDYLSIFQFGKINLREQANPPKSENEKRPPDWHSRRPFFSDNLLQNVLQFLYHISYKFSLKLIICRFFLPLIRYSYSANSNSSDYSQMHFSNLHSGSYKYIH